jgi:hypothetical protein
MQYMSYKLYLKNSVNLETEYLYEKINEQLQNFELQAPINHE